MDLIPDGLLPESTLKHWTGRYYEEKWIMHLATTIFIIGVSVLVVIGKTCIYNCGYPTKGEDEDQFSGDYSEQSYYSSLVYNEASLHAESNGTCIIVNMTASCVSLDLHKVPQVETNILTFNLSCNCIETIPNNTFLYFTILQQLDLSNNYITSLESLAFSGLSSLMHLNLRCNKLKMNGLVFHEDVFSPLTNLRFLKINRNNRILGGISKLEYPDKALSKLISLTDLYVDGLEKVSFGLGFRNMTSLVNLTTAGYFEGYCKMTSLTNETFQNVFMLRFLDISSCFIDGSRIESGAFAHLSNLYSLNLKHNEDIDVQNLNTVFYSLKNIKTLKVLKMQLIVNRYSLGICLDSSYIKYFPQYLEHFEAKENNLEGVDANVFSLLSPSLKYLDVGRNRFVFGIYLQNLSQMTSLKHIKLNGGSLTYQIPTRYPYQLHDSKLSSNCTIYSSSTYNHTNTFIFTLPPNLEKLEMNRAGLSYTLSRINVSQNKLTHLSINNNYFPGLEGPFNGLNNLQYFDVSFSFVSYISNRFFANLPSLLYLNLSSNLLGNFFTLKESENIFDSLISLQVLNLSFNDIRDVQPNMFRNLINLCELYLQKNNLGKFDVNISSLFNLVKLNLKLNRISTLPVNITRHIDLILQMNKTVVINLSFSPISCQCTNLDFILWMVSSKAFHPDFKYYHCFYNDDTTQLINDKYTSTLDILNHSCLSHFGIFLASGGFSLVIAFIVIGAIIYRFRWRIRYLYYAAYLHYSKSDCTRVPEYKYDAFVSYDHKDWKFVEKKLFPEMEKRHIKLCIHSKDFAVGDWIASNIVKAICSSRRTVVVLTRSMIHSYWCGYEIQMANMEAAHTNRQVLLFLLMESIPSGDMGVELLYNIRNNTYLPYPEDGVNDETLTRLWDKLAYDIKN
ncbi:hypothetical protein Btru_004241 [Bulinus truncatus]|nr:hypothetical protein Btru_004241 [Bulinus truncatus]